MTAPIDDPEPGAQAGKDSAGGAVASAPKRWRPSVIGVLGELLITAGVLVLLFLGWQIWWNSWILAGQQTSAASA